jgi:hypothetical protein
LRPRHSSRPVGCAGRCFKPIRRVLGSVSLRAARRPRRSQGPIFVSQAVCGESDTCRHGNMPASVHRRAERAGLDSSPYGAHSLRRTKPAKIYKKTGNLRAVQPCLATRSWRAPCVISGSRLMRSASRSRSNFNRAQYAALRTPGPQPIRDDRARHFSRYPLLNVAGGLQAGRDG